MDKDTRDEIDRLRQALCEVKLEALATRVALMALMQTQRDRNDLFLAFDPMAEQSIAQTLPGEYSGALVDHFRAEVDKLREFIKSIPGRSHD
jgi:hypothetical protein